MSVQQNRSRQSDRRTQQDYQHGKKHRYAKRIIEGRIRQRFGKISQSHGLHGFFRIYRHFVKADYEIINHRIAYQ